MTAARIPLSVLDLASVVTGQTSRDALLATTDAARTADRLGYSRFWVAEHHNMAAVASTSPPVLMAHIAAATERIKLGSGGVMLPNHAPLAVAEQFAILESLHPGRIDLGIGRAPGSDQGTAAALRRTASSGAAEEFVADIQSVYAYLNTSGSDPLDAQGRRPIAATPAPTSIPELWVLGSSLTSAMVAGMMGLPYAFANHFSGENTDAAVALYRERFRPSGVLDEPRVLVTMATLVAESDEAARRHAAPSVLQYIDLRRNVLRPLRSVQEADAHDWSATEAAFRDARLSVSAVGSIDTVGAVLQALLDRTGADELMISVQAGDVGVRNGTLEAVAGLQLMSRGSYGVLLNGAQTETSSPAPTS